MSKKAKRHVIESIPLSKGKGHVVKHTVSDFDPDGMGMPGKAKTTTNLHPQEPDVAAMMQQMSQQGQQPQAPTPNPKASPKKKSAAPAKKGGMNAAAKADWNKRMALAKKGKPAGAKKKKGSNQVSIPVDDLVLVGTLTSTVTSIVNDGLLTNIDSGYFTFVGTASQTIAPEWFDGTNWWPLTLTPNGGGTGITSLVVTPSVSAAYTFNQPGIRKIRIRQATFVSGSIAVIIVATPAHIDSGSSVTLAPGAAVELLDSGGTNKASINASGQLAVIETAQTNLGKTVKFATGTTSSSGDTVVATPTGSNKIKVLSVSDNSSESSANNYYYRSDTGGTQISKTTYGVLGLPVGNNEVGGMVELFETAAGKALYINLSAAVATSWHISYLDEA